MLLNSIKNKLLFAQVHRSNVAHVAYVSNQYNSVYTVNT